MQRQWLVGEGEARSANGETKRCASGGAAARSSGSPGTAPAVELVEPAAQHAAHVARAARPASLMRSRRSAGAVDGHREQAAERSSRACCEPIDEQGAGIQAGAVVAAVRVAGSPAQPVGATQARGQRGNEGGLDRFHPGTRRRRRHGVEAQVHVPGAAAGTIGTAACPAAGGSSALMPRTSGRRWSITMASGRNSASCQGCPAVADDARGHAAFGPAARGVDGGCGRHWPTVRAAGAAVVRQQLIEFGEHAHVQRRAEYRAGAHGERGRGRRRARPGRPAVLRATLLFQQGAQATQHGGRRAEASK